MGDSMAVRRRAAVLVSSINKLSGEETSGLGLLLFVVKLFRDDCFSYRGYGED